MLKKGDPNSTLPNLPKKHKLHHESTHPHHDYNKENISRSLLEPLDDSHSLDNPGKQKSHELSCNGSTLISPTFQSIPQLSLKDHLYKQDASYINVNFSLKDIPKKPAPISEPSQEERLASALQEVEEMKQKVVEHYKSKKYWNKISALFEHEEVDAVFAWQEAIQKYKAVKTSNQQLVRENERLAGEATAQAERAAALEKQIIQDKNETRVLSQKKCKGCENLELKQKDYQELYGQHKKTLKQVEEQREAAAEGREQARKMEDKYTLLVQVKEELEKKTGKLLEREKELSAQVQKLEKALKQDCSSSKDLHIQLQKLKEEKYQLEKALGKLEEKHRRETADLRLELQGIEDEKAILAAQAEKAKGELNQVKARSFKAQLELEGAAESLTYKSLEHEEFKKRHFESLGEELRRRNEVEALLQAKEEQLKKAYHLLDEAESAKLSKEIQLDQEKKAARFKEEELAKQVQANREQEERLRDQEERLREQEERLREFEGSQQRMREGSQMMGLNRNRNTIGNFQANAQSTSPQNSALLGRICGKIKELYWAMTQGQEGETLKRKPRDESQQREQVNLLRTERLLNQIYTEFSSLRNRHEFVCKENETLKLQIDNEASYKQQEAEQLQREIDLKEEALRAISACIPEDLKEPVLEFLCATEQLAKEDHQDLDFDDYEDLKLHLDGQAREWRDHYLKIDRRLKKAEEEARRLEQENEQLRRRAKLGDPKRQLQTEYDYKKDVRKKYNI